MAAQTAKAVSSVIVYQNMLDGINSHIDAGESRLFLVGKYLDTFKLENNKAKFLSREVRIENPQARQGVALADLNAIGATSRRSTNRSNKNDVEAHMRGRRGCGKFGQEI